MAHDYSDQWSTVAWHDANVYASTASPLSTPFNTDQAVVFYKSKGVPSDQIVLGMPL
jgi:chitinase